GAPFSEAASASGAGSAFVYTYPTPPPGQNRSLTFLRRHDGLATGEHFGRSVAYLHANGNLIADVLVGAPAAPGPARRPPSGRIYVFAGWSGQALFRIAGPGSATGNDHFGAAVAGGDVNHDGYDEVVVGEPDRDVSSVPDPGRAYVYQLTGRG